ncbi:MAG TPA: hypothetical protein VHJ18_08410 [Streptosporangiaceae bacterium]|jgi:hypothetical protein|nr:hypothetical protein [Streptosporangiaceae bacterium]
MAAVMIGVDPHKGSHTAVAIDAAEVPLGTVRVRASAAQVNKLVEWAAGWPERTWAVEGAGGLGHVLASSWPRHSTRGRVPYLPAGAQGDAVPTCIAGGPDGILYVGELLGFYSPGHARVWRVVPGHAPHVWAGGLTAVQGCGFGADGSTPPNSRPAG